MSHDDRIEALYGATKCFLELLRVEESESQKQLEKDREQERYFEYLKASGIYSEDEIDKMRLELFKEESERLNKVAMIESIGNKGSASDEGNLMDNMSGIEDSFL